MSTPHDSEIPRAATSATESDVDRENRISEREQSARSNQRNWSERRNWSEQSAWARNSHERSSTSREWSKGLPARVAIIGTLLLTAAGCNQADTSVVSGPETKVTITDPVLPGPLPPTVEPDPVARDEGPAPIAAPAPPRQVVPPKPVVRKPVPPKPESTKPPTPVPPVPVITVTGRTELVNTLNTRRQSMGLQTVVYKAELSDAAETCARIALAAKDESACSFPVVTMGPANPKPEDVMTSWFAENRKKTELTRHSTTAAGGAIVSDGSTSVSVMALED